MTIAIQSRFVFTAARPTDCLLQFEAAGIPEQRLLDSTTELGIDAARIAAAEDIGQRIWLRAEGRVEVRHEARVAIERQVFELSALGQIAPHDLPAEATRYLFDSRYCPGDRFQSFIEAEFSGAAGGGRVAAIRDWVAQKLAYAPGCSGPDTTALDSFVDRRGICRDFAHVVISLCRASGIPARYLACYAPDVTPQDFHAVAQVFLADPETGHGGTWQMVDATGMADASEIVTIGVGADAAEVSFLTSFGPVELIDKQVRVTRG